MPNVEELVNTTYENGLISILLNSDIDRIVEIASQIDNDDFSERSLAQGLYMIIKKLVSEGREINLINIIAEAEKHNKIINALGGSEDALENLKLIQSANIDPDEFQTYADEVKKYSLMRQTIKKTEKLKQKFYNEGNELTLTQVINEPQKLFVDVLVKKKEEGIHIAKGIDQYIEATEDEIGIIPGFPSRWDSLTKTILAHQKKALEVYYAPTHEGKSLFLLNEGDYLGNELLVPTLYIDSEMLEEQQQPRLLSIRTGLQYEDIKLKTALRIQENKERLQKEAEKIKNGKLYWVSLQDYNEENIERIVRYYIVKYGIEVLIFDYIKISTVKGKLNETQQIGNLCDFLKNGIAKKLNLNVIAATQADEHDRTRVADSQRVKRYADILANWRKKDYEQIQREQGKLGRYVLEFTKNRESISKPALNFDFNGNSSEIIEIADSCASKQQSLFLEENSQTKTSIKSKQKKRF